jgi:nickel-dependent lactate racemase
MSIVVSMATGHQDASMTPLDAAACGSILATQLPPVVPAGARALLIVPDGTRTAPVGMLFNRIAEVLLPRVARLDVLIALGTHRPMTEEAIRRHLDLRPEHEGRVRVFNHTWNDPSQLEVMGELSAEDVARHSDGLMRERVPLTLNRMVREYDPLLILGPVFPHEMVGFSGGSKYLFPGISGPEMIDIVHWIGALNTSMRTIGVIDTPIRRVLDAAADRLPLNISTIAFVAHRNEVVQLGVGSLRDAWRASAEVAARVHVRRYPEPFRRVLARCPEMYPDLWTGGKCVYKCEPVVADGGDLIVYAPHVKTFTEVHDALADQLGFHVRDYYLADWERWKRLPRAIMAYATIVKGDGTYRDGVERPRINVHIASQIPRERVERLGLNYIDPATIRVEEWMNRESEGVLYVERAGETLYRLDRA